jgi:hypothetical protein
LSLRGREDSALKDPKSKDLGEPGDDPAYRPIGFRAIAAAAFAYHPLRLGRISKSPRLDPSCHLDFIRHQTTDPACGFHHELCDVELGHPTATNSQPSKNRAQ